MSRVVLVRWVCDRCHVAVEQTDTSTMPEGWVHTMVGTDLCGGCQP